MSTLNFEKYITLIHLWVRAQGPEPLGQLWENFCLAVGPLHTQHRLVRADDYPEALHVFPNHLLYFLLQLLLSDFYTNHHHFAFFSSELVLLWLSVEFKATDIQICSWGICKSETWYFDRVKDTLFQS